MRNTGRTGLRVLGAALVLAMAGNAMAYEFIVESRTGGKNFTSYSDVNMANSGVKSLAAGCTAGIGCRYANNTTCRATYSFLCPETGNYQVDVTWPSSIYGDTSVPHAVTHDGGTFNKNMNQQQAAGGNNAWNLLGTFQMTAGQTYTVVQTNPTLEGTASQRMMADAVRWSKTCGCGDVARVSVKKPVLTGDTTVTVAGVAGASKVSVYANGVKIGENLAPGAGDVVVNVSPALSAGQRIDVTQTAAPCGTSIEGCLYADGPIVDDCAQIPAVSVAGTLLAADTTVQVSGVDATATAVKVYSNGVLIGTNNAPAGAATVTVTTTALVNGERVTAAQAIRGLDGCIPTTGGKIVGDCTQVPAVTVVGLTDAGRTIVRVSGVTAGATAVKVYANNGTADTLIGTNSAPIAGVDSVTVTGLVEGQTIKAVQTIRVDGCMPTAGRRVTATNVIEDFEGTVTIQDNPSVLTGGEYRVWYDVLSVAYTEVIGPADTNRGRLFGSKCLNVTDHGWQNGAYAIYDQVIPETGTYHLSFDMLIDEPEGLDYDYYKTYQVGVVVNGAHRASGGTLPAVTSGITGAYPCLTPLRDGVSNTEAVKVYAATFTANAGDNLLFVFSTDVSSYDSRKTATPAGYVGMKIDNIKLIAGAKPSLCTDVVNPTITTTAGTPLEAGKTLVTVQNIDPNATAVSVLADGEVIGTTNPAGASQLDLTVTPLVAGKTITGSQTVGGITSCACPGASGLVVGTGANSPIKVTLGIRETNATGGTIGSDGGITGNIEWIGASTAVSGAPQGKALSTSLDWQTVTFSSAKSGGTDPVLSFNAGNGVIDGAFGTLEHIAFSIDAPYNTGRYTVKVDSIYNGTTLLCDFDNTTTFPAESIAMFRAPANSGTTAQHLMAYPNIAKVDSTEGADGSAQCYQFQFQFLDGQAKRWVRLTTVDDTSSPDMPLQNPLIDLSQPITIKFKLYGAPPCGTVFADSDADGDVDMVDFAAFQRCLTLGAAGVPAECGCFDHPFNGVINADDLTAFHNCASGPGVPATPGCGN